jgi:hypothetical protein
MPGGVGAVVSVPGRWRRPAELRGRRRECDVLDRFLDIVRGGASRALVVRGEPVALAAWMLDHDARSYEDIAAAFDGDPVGNLTRDEVLDNITLYWLTNTGVSASRLYWEYKGGFSNAKGVAIPVAATVFPGEQYQAPRSWAERAYPNLIYEVDRGGQFAAWEQPQLFTEELRAAFRSLR